MCSYSKLKVTGMERGEDLNWAQGEEMEYFPFWKNCPDIPDFLPGSAILGLSNILEESCAGTHEFAHVLLVCPSIIVVSPHITVD